MKKQPAAASTIARSDIARCAAERKYMPLLLWYHMTIMHEQPQHASMWKRTRYVARTVRLGWMSAQEVAGPGSSEKDRNATTRCHEVRRGQESGTGNGRRPALEVTIAYALVHVRAMVVHARRALEEYGNKSRRNDAFRGRLTINQALR